MEREYIRDRTLEGHESARKRGKTIGGAGVTDESMLSMALHLRDQESPLTALHINRPSVGIANSSSLRDRIGVNFTQLRQDRFLDEARETADPVRLMRLFGITSYTAIHYVRAAHPERFAIDPTQA